LKFFSNKFLVTLASNVDNLKKKVEESNAAAAKATQMLNEQLAKNFETDGAIADAKKEAEAAKKTAAKAVEKAKAIEAATSGEIASLKEQIAVSSVI
jgi:hypothetical protein